MNLCECVAGASVLSQIFLDKQSKKKIALIKWITCVLYVVDSIPLVVTSCVNPSHQTLLHEMIHALLFVTQNNRDRDGHGPEFCKHMNRINKASGANITVGLTSVSSVWNLAGSLTAAVEKAWCDLVLFHVSTTPTSAVFCKDLKRLCQPHVFLYMLLSGLSHVPR